MVYVIKNTATDPAAFHGDGAGEYVALTEKVIPIDNDVLAIEDSAAGNSKKKIKISNIPGIASPNYPGNHISKLALSWSSISTVTIAAGNCRDSTDLFNIDNAAARVADIAVAGAGGLDTGSEAANTWYAVLLISDSTGVAIDAALLTVTPAGPTLPAGYDIYRRVGWVRNSSGSDFLKFISSGSESDRSVLYDEDTTATSVLSGGTAVAFTDIDLSAFLPPGLNGVLVFLDVFLKDDSDFLAFRPDGSAVTFAGSPWRIQTGKNGGPSRNETVKALIAVSGIVEYRLSFADNNLNLSVAGFSDNL